MNREADMIRASIEDLYDDVRPPNRSDTAFLYRHLDAALKSERRMVVDAIRMALFAKGWTFEADSGPEADVSDVLEKVS